MVVVWYIVIAVLDNKYGFWIGTLFLNTTVLQDGCSTSAYAFYLVLIGECLGTHSLQLFG